MPTLDAFTEIALTLLAAAAVGAAGTGLRQPLIVSFIAVGILVGPAGAGLVTRHEQVELLASIGISLLLFVVGLKLDVHTIRTLGAVALAAGVAQIAITVALAFGLAFALGMNTLTASYVAVAITLSSTIIVVKLLSDKQEIDALHGRMAVGLLIVQDLAVILMMIGINALGSESTGGQSLVVHAVTILANGLGFLLALVMLSLWVLPAVTTLLARTPELLVLSGIAWAVVLASVGEALGLSKEVGAFVAGASLASTPYREAIASRLVTVRDFLLLFFFIDLGSRLDLTLLGQSSGRALLFSVFVLVAKPLIVMGIMAAMGYRKRTGFLSGLVMAQVSEFSLILAALGVSVGHIGRDAMGLITTTGLITIALSTYLIKYSTRLYEWLAPWLTLFDRKVAYREEADEVPTIGDVVVLGLGRYGSGIIPHLRLRGRRVIGVDFDPEALARWRREGIPVVYGDATDPELFDHLSLSGVSWVVSTTRETDTNKLLLKQLHERHYEGKVAVAVQSSDEADVLRLNGADVLLRPYADAAEQAADAITAPVEQLGAVANATPGLREVRLTSASLWAGHRISEIPLRDVFGATVLAVSRGGRTFFNPGASFQLFPSDRVFLSGEPATLDHAIEYLAMVDVRGQQQEEEQFTVEEVHVGTLDGWAGQSLAALELPARFNVAVLAVAGNRDQMAAPDPHKPLSADDRLVLAGTPSDLARARASVNRRVGDT